MTSNQDLNPKDLTTKLLKLMKIEKPEVIVSNDQEVTSIQINASDPQTGVLIGHHGETISSLQLILTLMLNQAQTSWKPVHLNVGDYRQRREAALTELAQSVANRAKASGKDIILTSLPAHERRIIHLILSDDPQVETFSEGTGRSRHLIVRPKQSQSSNTNQ